MYTAISKGEKLAGSVLCVHIPAKVQDIATQRNNKHKKR